MANELTYCANGCPYGADGAICFLKRTLTCPIDAMYQKLTQYESEGQRCTWCSNAKLEPNGRWIAQGHCGECPKFCPACEAPK